MAEPERTYKPAPQINVGDYLPFSRRGKTHWLEVVKVEEKRTRVWITVVDPDGEKWTTRPSKEAELFFREFADHLAANPLAGEES